MERQRAVRHKTKSLTLFESKTGVNVSSANKVIIPSQPPECNITRQVYIKTQKHTQTQVPEATQYASVDNALLRGIRRAMGDERFLKTGSDGRVGWGGRGTREGENLTGPSSYWRPQGGPPGPKEGGDIPRTQGGRDRPPTQQRGVIKIAVGYMFRSVVVAGTSVGKKPRGGVTAIAVGQKGEESVLWYKCPEI